MALHFSRSVYRPALLLFALLLASCSTTREVVDTVGDATGAVAEGITQGVEFVSELFTEEEEAAEEPEPPTPIAIATEGTKPPFHTTGTNGSVYGLDIEFGKALCAELNFDCLWYINDASDLVPELNARKIDLVISSLAINTVNMQRMRLSDVYLPLIPGLLTDAHTTLAENITLAGLAEYRLGKISDIPVELYTDAYLDASSFRHFANMAVALEALQSGHIDVLLHDALILQATAKTHPSLNYSKLPQDESYPITGYSIGVRKSNASTPLLEKINQGISTLRDKGTIREILAQQGYTLPLPALTPATDNSFSTASAAGQ